MSKIDLLLTVNQAAAAATDQDGLESVGGLIPVLVHYTGELAPLQAVGFQPRSVFSDVASGDIAPGQLAALGALESVVFVEGAYPMGLDLDVAVPEARANTVHNAPGVGVPPTTYRGRNVIVGIIDSGIDYTHPTFRNADAAGTTRILRIWDQNLAPAGGEASPAGYTYGVEYTAAAINTALGNANPFTIVRHQDPSGVGHGTHVAGIAAGNGRPAGTFVGLAPDADLIVVSARSVGDIGDSVDTADAIHYIFTQAAALNRPCVINMSRSMNTGPHDGTTLLERAIDQELGTPGRAYLNSAGNQAARLVYTTGTVPANGSLACQFSIPVPVDATAAIDIWYERAGRLTVTVTDPPPVGAPAGESTAALAAPAAGAPAAGGRVLASGNQVTIGSTVDANPFNRDNRILIRLASNTAAAITPGNWTITLADTSGQAVRFHAWIERGTDIPSWVTPVGLTQSTIATPATSREAIAVGSYISKAATGVGGISNSSSRGPTRDGRIKPDISAPGAQVMSARASNLPAGAGGPTDASGQYHLLGGTSMSTPVAAGAVALILQKNPTLLAEQIRNGLIATARTDANTNAAGPAPNNTFGHGKLDVAAAVAHNYAAARNPNWVRIRSELHNWTMSPLPPTFEIAASENGDAVIELAWDPQALLAPSNGYVPLRYYSSDAALNVTINRAAGGPMPIAVPAQTIRLTNNSVRWTMPQALWDGYLEEMAKARLNPPQSTMSNNLYYRVRFTATGATSPLVWPPDASFNNNPLAQRLAIIALNQLPNTQVAPDQPAIDAMDALSRTILRWLWEHLPVDNADRQALAQIFSHRFFTNEMETNVRAKILTLWLYAGPASRQRLPQLLNMQFRNAANVENTILKQPDLRDHAMLIDHLLALRSITPHPDIQGVTVAEQLVDDVITEIIDPNGQINRGAATSAYSGLQALLINRNASEYARLMKGLLSATGQATLANGDTVAAPPGIFQSARYAGAQADPFLVRTNSELAFQSSLLKYALGSAFPAYDASAAPNAPNGINTVFQATLRLGLNAAQMERALAGLFGRAFATNSVPNGATPDQRNALRNTFVQTMTTTPEPLLLVVHWDALPGTAGSNAVAVVALRSEGGRVFFKNTQYAGSRPPTGATPNSTAANPPRRYDDPTQALESMSDGDLGQWISWFHRPA